MHETNQKLPFNLFTAAARAAFIIAVWLLPSTNAHTAIYACPTGNGDTAYQDRPCAIVKAPKKSGSTDSASSTAHSDNQPEYPLGIHPSWFTPPALAPQPAYCDRLGCDCASQTRNFRHGLIAAVVDALFLEAAWHRYSSQITMKENEPPKGLRYLQLQIDIEESACEIQMSQTTIRNYAAHAVKKIEDKAELAEQRGNTDYSQCEDPSSSECADVEAYQLYKRVLMDLETLRSPRSYFMAEAALFSD